LRQGFDLSIPAAFTFEAITGGPATRIREYIAKHPEMFGLSKPARVFT
jgi:hypothetical protein